MFKQTTDNNYTYKNPKGRRGTAGFLRCLASVAILFALAFAFSQEAEARQAIANLDQVAASDCSREIYTGLSSGASSERCDDLFFVPTSAAIKCGLYLDAGYPSTLMRKACQLYDRGAIEFFLEDTSAEK